MRGDTASRFRYAPIRAGALRSSSSSARARARRRRASCVRPPVCRGGGRALPHRAGPRRIHRRSRRGCWIDAMRKLDRYEGRAHAKKWKALRFSHPIGCPEAIARAGCRGAEVTFRRTNSTRSRAPWRRSHFSQNELSARTCHPVWRQSCISQNELDAIRRTVTALHHFAKRILLDQAQGGGEVTFRKTNPASRCGTCGSKVAFRKWTGRSRAR
jgi:hypothetical protein